MIGSNQRQIGFQTAAGGLPNGGRSTFAPDAALSYDNSGNLTWDQYMGGTFTYTPFKQMATAVGSATAGAYGYDGDQTRVWKQSPAGMQFFVHGPGGSLLAEYLQTTTDPTLVREYVSLSGKLLASIGAPETARPAVSVMLTSPHPGPQGSNGTNITLTAMPHVTSGGVTRVEFYAYGIWLANATSAPYQWTWPSVPTGGYVLTAHVIASDGTVAVSGDVPITVGTRTGGQVTGISVSPAPAGQPTTITVTRTNPCAQVDLSRSPVCRSCGQPAESQDLVPLLR